MTRILRCDRCKEEVSWGGSKNPLIDLDPCWEYFDGCDICPKCMEAFRRDFMGQKEPVDGCQRTLDGADEPWNTTTSVSIKEPSPNGTITYTVDDLVGELAEKSAGTLEALADNPSEGTL